MTWGTIASEALGLVSEPLRLLFCLALVGYAWLWRKRTCSRRKLWALGVPLIGLAVLTWPPVRYLIIGGLEWRCPALKALPDDVDAIVVLAGGTRPANAVRPWDELDDASTERTVHAARLAQERPGGLPVLACGGKPSPEEPGGPPASLMRALLVKLGVEESQALAEEQSRSTFENAREAAKVAKALGWRKVVVVTDAMHSPRALGCFHKQGLDAVAGPCRAAANPLRFQLRYWLPDPSREEARDALHEWIGWGWYVLRGRA